MTRFFYTKGFEREWHPSAEDLLFYVDGELKATKSSSVRSHLEACWTCRARVEELQETITSFIQYLDTTLTPSLDPPPRQWQTFQSRLRNAGSGQDSHPRRAQFLCWFRRAFWAHRPAFVTALVLVTLLCLFIVRFENIPPVSANQLLTNATEAQVRRIREVLQPVVHQKLNVQRSSPAALPKSRVTWEIWCDPGAKRFFQRFESIDGAVRFESRSESFSTLSSPAGGVHNPAAAADPRSAAARKPAEIPELVRQLEQVYQTNRMDLTRPLSPSVYRSWRESMRQKSEEVKEMRLSDGGKAFALVTTVGQAVPENGIVKA
ncbi:MAG: hypothetical protein L0312_21410, partial [Acidobacteria bacterium]|nr:hypothetical protein [Acidobacteriota bacterium]